MRNMRMGLMIPGALLTVFGLVVVGVSLLPMGISIVSFDTTITSAPTEAYQGDTITVTATLYMSAWITPAQDWNIAYTATFDGALVEEGYVVSKPWETTIEYTIPSTASPQNYTFTVEGKVIADGSTIATDTDEVTILVRESEATTYALTAAVASGSGSVSGAGNYEQGASVTLTALPDTYYGFEYWSGYLSGSLNPKPLTMPAQAITVYANFNYIGGTPTYTLDGYVADSYSAAISGATVALGDYPSATTSGTGYFAIPSITSGTYTLTASKSGYQAYLLDDYSVTSDQSKNISLAPTGSATYTISGYITGDGESIGNALILIGTQDAYTSSSGRYGLSGFVNGTYAVAAYAQGYSIYEGSVTVSGADKTFDVDMTPIEDPSGANYALWIGSAIAVAGVVMTGAGAALGAKGGKRPAVFR